jgi:hypothetical protein
MSAPSLTGGRLTALSSLVVVSVFVCGTANADSLSARYGDATCTETIDNGDGRSLEFYGEVDSLTDQATVGFKYVIEFQKQHNYYDRCAHTNRLAVRQMQLDIEKSELELELLRRRAEEAYQPQGSRDEHDW